jgi:hypothetical protein
MAFGDLEWAYAGQYVRQFHARIRWADERFLNLKEELVGENQLRAFQGGTDPEFERMRLSFDLQCVGAQAVCAQAIELPVLGDRSCWVKQAGVRRV